VELVRIFGPKHKKQEGLFAVRYDENSEDEVERLFDCWNDNAYLESFAQEFGADLPGDPGENQVLHFSHSVQCEAQELEALLYEADPETTESPVPLQELFKPLVNAEGRLYLLQPSKTSARTRKRPHPLLRIYGIRIAAGTYIVTGGAIKLAPFMKDRPNTAAELAKIERVRDWLKANDITEPDDFGNLHDER
jgi:hypothetical protein